MMRPLRSRVAFAGDTPVPYIPFRTTNSQESPQ